MTNVHFESIYCNNNGKQVIYKFPYDCLPPYFNRYKGLYVYSEFRKENHPLKELLGDDQFATLQQQFQKVGDRLMYSTIVNMITIPIIINSELDTLSNKCYDKDTITCFDNKNLDCNSHINFINSLFLNTNELMWGYFDVETCLKINNWKQKFKKFTLHYDVETEYLPGGKKYLEAEQKLKNLGNN
jgi:hypothetical protein